MQLFINNNFAFSCIVTNDIDLQPLMSNKYKHYCLSSLVCCKRLHKLLLKITFYYTTLLSRVSHKESYYITSLIVSCFYYKFSIREENIFKPSMHILVLFHVYESGPCMLDWAFGAKLFRIMAKVCPCSLIGLFQIGHNLFSVYCGAPWIIDWIPI